MSAVPVHVFDEQMGLGNSMTHRDPAEPGNPFLQVCTRDERPTAMQEGETLISVGDAQMQSRERAAISSPPSGINKGCPLSGPMYFHPDDCSDGEAVDRPMGTPEGPPAVPVLTGDQQVPPAQKVRVTMATWNLAGVCARDVAAVFDHVVQCDVVAVQEFPKQPAGWKTIETDAYSMIVHQNHAMYRGVGFMYRKKQFMLVQKLATQRGMWAKLRHVQSGVAVWIGSLHLPNSEPKEEIQRNMGEFAKQLPKGADRAVALGDFNIQFKWREGVEGVQTDVLSSKWAMLRQCMAEVGLQQVAPAAAQMHLPTFHSRKGSTQIDGAFLSGNVNVTMDIQQGSRHEVGTDHDRVQLAVTLKAVWGAPPKSKETWWAQDATVYPSPTPGHPRVACACCTAHQAPFSWTQVPP